MAFIEGVDRNQKMMFPEYVDDYISEENPVRIIDSYIAVSYTHLTLPTILLV